ncbi:MAG: UvrD-helicase domain-containing protein, partial [Rickettsiaceae bacterium]|nr:UvrD-helicase domain-containing protein [Rickettsiaceae bacterium]
MLKQESQSAHNKQQLKSSDPSRSVWVSASAGTGKTKVLTDRVLKLLLSNVSPHKILCLTFTKAAATEMLSRINNELKTWSCSSNEFLLQRLYILLGREATSEELSLSKKLFNILLKSSNFVQIQTIHGFCQSLLRLFPLEACLAPGFEVIDEIKASDLIEKVSHRIFANITSEEMDETARFMETNIHDTSLITLQSEIINSRVKFKGLIDHFQNGENYASYLAQQMSIEKSKEEYFEDFANFIDGVGLIDQDLGGESAVAYNSYFFLAKNERISSFDHLKIAFLTKLGEMRKKLIPREIVKEHPDLEEKLRNIQTAVFELDQNIKSISLINASKHLFVLSKSLITEYENEKKYQGYLDYDDLIYYSLRLLSDSEFREWVLYKLDGGIEHILIDESQDTSPQQWKIIASLMQEFYSGGDERGRTIFVVGDEKQSIYSFQGADINTFKGMKEFLHYNMTQSLKAYENIDLASSYRSTFSVIDFVHKTFEKVTHLYGDIFPNGVSLECFRSDSPGRVELWPSICSEEEEDLFWPEFNRSSPTETSSQLMSKAIAKYIKNQMDSGVILASTKRKISAGDIMILVRKRS